MKDSALQERTEIKELLLRSRKEAETHMEAIKSQQPLTRPFLHEHICGYVICKFMLQGEDPNQHSFPDLAELSLSRSMKVSKELVNEFDIARSCDGATSVMTKKVLLFLAIQKALGIELPASRSATLTTMTDFSDMVWDAMLDTTAWHPRMTG